MTTDPSGPLRARNFEQQLREMNDALLVAAVHQHELLAKAHQAEDALRQSEERFRTMANNISQLAWIADAEGRFYWFNQRWYDYTATTLEQMQGWGWKEALHPEHIDRVVERIQRSWDTGEVWDDSFPLRGKDGEYRWFLSRARPVHDEQGNVLRWFGTHTDVTEQRELESLIWHQAEQLAGESRRKDEFLAMLSHELRNPLAAISNVLEIWKGNDGSKGGWIEAQQILERQLRHQVRLVDDLLDVSRISRGLVIVKADFIDLAQSIRNCLSAIQWKILEHQHQVNLLLPGDEIMVMGDIVRLEQIVTNLLSNAIKYTPNGGTIDIRLERDQGMAIMSISDSGIGMAADFLDRAFGMFVQADKQIDQELGGLGVGLALVRRLVELHGGTVEAGSPGLGKGSTFVVRLPSASAPANSLTLEKERRPQPAAPPRRVLVVDDNEDARSTTAIVLEMYGHTAKTAGDGPSALAMLEEFNPEAVLLDIGLPGMDGYEVCRNIRGSPSHSHVLIIALSGYGGQGDVGCAREAGFDHHLTKPATSSQIADVFRLYDERDGP